MKRFIALILAVLMIAVFPVTLNSASYKLGDINIDGAINAKDVLLLRRYIAGLENSIIEAAADVNGSGDINFADVLLLRRHIVREVTIEQIPIADAYIGDMYISGVSVREYSIVVPAECDVFTAYAAELLQDYVDDKTGIEIPIITDASEESDYEFLIGETNRAESVLASSAVTLGNNQYLLKQDGGKIVMLGNSYMIGAGVGKFTYDYITYDPSRISQICNINDLPSTNAAMTYQPRPAKNAILMIGDGMGQNHVSASVRYNLARNEEPGYTEFSATRLPYSALVTTSSVDTINSGGTTPTDSSAAGTALACGIKTKNHYVGLDRNQRTVLNIRELAVSFGKRNAIMSTELKEGATPACYLIHYPERTQLDQIGILENAVTDCDYIKGDIEENLLPETKYALDMLSTNNEAGFFTMIEEARIDTYSHTNDRAQTLHAMARFNKAIQYAMVFTVAHPDTLLIITADHETGGVGNGFNFTVKTHTTANVNVFAIGSGAERFSGTVDNTLIPKVIAAQWGVNNFGS